MIKLIIFLKQKKMLLHNDKEKDTTIYADEITYFKNEEKILQR
jgi:hypothetical protein